MVTKEDDLVEERKSAIRTLIEQCGGDPSSFEAELISQQIQSSLRLLRDGHDTGQLKLITRALKEMRYAYHVFNKYEGQRVSIFGSARTPEDHPDYIAASKFSTMMSAKGWMCITGAADGIMKAGLEGIHPESSFGLSILLPFESGANAAIEGDPKHIVFRYFFTRKLMFMSHSEALAVFPGGFGTMDELFEALTLMQTGKASIIPVVLIEGGKKGYWNHWKEYVDHCLLGNGWISAEDMSFFHIASSPEDAVEHIQQFYRRYVSSRYVGDELSITLKEALSEKQLEQVNAEFPSLLQSGCYYQSSALPGELNYLDLPRLVFHANRGQFGLLRRLLDFVNKN